MAKATGISEEWQSAKRRRLHETVVPLYPSGQGEETVIQSQMRAGAVTKTKS